MMRTLILGLALLFLATPGLAVVPQTVSFQGVLTDGGGQPVADSSYTVRFTMYNAATGGNAVWGDILNVSTTGGVFDVLLGENAPITAAFDRPYWLEIILAGEPAMTPRIALSSAPYSLRSQAVQNGAIDGAALANGTAVRSLNGLTDAVTIVGGANVTVTPGAGLLTIDATGGGGGLDADWAISGDDLCRSLGNVWIGTCTGPDVKLYVKDTGPQTVLRIDNGTESQLHLDSGTIEGFLTVGSNELELEVTGLATTDLRLHSPERIIHESNYHSFLIGSTTPLERARLSWDASWELLNPGSTRTVRLDSGQTTGDMGGQLQLYNASGVATVEIDASDDGAGTAAATLALRNSSGDRTVEFDAQEGGVGGGAQLNMYNGAGTRTVELDSDFGSGKHANLRMFSQSGVKTVELDAVEAGQADQGAALKLYNEAGQLTIELDGDFGTSNEGRIITDVIEIQGGSDLSEQFDVSTSAQTVEPGMVVSIDPQRPGGLQISREAYDYRVAGIISGAGGVRPGMLMGQKGSEADGEHPVALTGRVYCFADATEGPIQPGDLLTTSDRPGHAMRVDDRSRAQGAILGKAMTGLEEGTGMVLVLVGLQ